MNSSQFLAELKQYLSFVTADERERVLHLYSERFEQAGNEGEAALIAEFGSPMSVAISLKRRMEAGKHPDAVSDKSPLCPTEDAPVADEAPESAPVEAEVTEAVPAPDAVPEAAPVPSETLEAAPISNQEPDDAPMANDVLKDYYSLDEEASSDFDEAVSPSSHIKPSGGGAKGILPTIGISLLSIIAAVFALALAAIGVILVLSGGNLILGGLQLLSYLDCALLLFGGGLALLGLGVLVIWFAIWAAITLISKMLKPSEPQKQGAARLKKIWKAIFVLAAVLAGVAIICAIVGFAMGGSVSGLWEKEPAALALETLSPDFIWRSICDIFGA